MSEITVRRATPEDTNLLASLATVSFYEAYFEQDESHDLANYLVENFGPSVIAAELSSSVSIYLIACRRGKAVGYAKLRDAEVHESVRSRNAIELQRCYLIERVWGTGLGDILLEQCFAEARVLGKEVLWLGVWEENHRGQSFYRRHGFERVGTLTFPYGNSVGINAVMQLRL
ncbi:MAG: GNAT family N-acetyltransferase [Pyrinomonadaceae bacterium]